MQVATPATTVAPLPQPGARLAPRRNSTVPVGDCPVTAAVRVTYTPALTGFTLAFARAVGEYGSVVFISPNTPGTEIAPMLIISLHLESAQRESAASEAAAIAVVLLVVSFALLILINLLERWNQRHGQ